MADDKMSRLRECVRQCTKLNFDPKRYAFELLSENLITHAQNEAIVSGNNIAERNVIFFLEILPGKPDKTIEQMIPHFDEVYAKILRETLFGNVERPAKKQMTESPFELLRGRLHEMFEHQFFSKINPIPSHELSFKVEEIWIELEMQRPGIDILWDKISQEKFWGVLYESLKEGPVLIRGEPGIGKSTLWKRICREWHLQNQLNDFDLVLPCRFRDASSVQNIMDLAVDWVNEFMSIDIDESFLKKAVEGRKVLLLLDGLDEFSGTCEELNKLIKRAKMLKFSLLITSRPLIIRFGENNTWRFFKINGFSDDSIRTYIAKFFKITVETLEENEKTRDIMQKIRKHRYLEDLARVPILLSFMCVAPETAKAKTKTELYLLFAKYLLNRFLDKYPDCDLEEFDVKDGRWWSLGKLAMKGLLGEEEQLVFKGEDLEDIEKIVFDIGYLSDEVTHGFRDKIRKAVNFQHKTVQEFFAAVAMVLAARKSCSENNSAHYFPLISAIAGSVDPDLVRSRLDEVVLFFLGLLEDLQKPEQNAISKFIAAYYSSNDLFNLTVYFCECSSNAIKALFVASLSQHDSLHLIGSTTEMAIILRNLSAQGKQKEIVWWPIFPTESEKSATEREPILSGKSQISLQEFHINFYAKDTTENNQDTLAEFLKKECDGVKVDIMKIVSNRSEVKLNQSILQSLHKLAPRELQLNDVIFDEDANFHSEFCPEIVMAELSPKNTSKLTNVLRTFNNAKKIWIYLDGGLSSFDFSHQIPPFNNLEHLAVFYYVYSDNQDTPAAALLFRFMASLNASRITIAVKLPKLTVEEILNEMGIPHSTRLRTKDFVISENNWIERFHTTLPLSIFSTVFVDFEKNHTALVTCVE